MRISKSLGVVLSAAGILASSPVIAGPVSVGSGGLRLSQIQLGYMQSLHIIRERALKQEAKDGGNLTPEHVAYFHRQLDRANEFHQRQLSNNNPLNVDADGSVNNVRSDMDWTKSNLVRVGAPS